MGNAEAVKWAWNILRYDNNTINPSLRPWHVKRDTEDTNSVRRWNNNTRLLGSEGSTTNPLLYLFLLLWSLQTLQLTHLFGAIKPATIHPFRTPPTFSSPWTRKMNSRAHRVVATVFNSILVMLALFSYMCAVQGSRPIHDQGHASPSFAALMLAKAKSGPSGKGPGHWYLLLRFATMAMSDLFFLPFFWHCCLCIKVLSVSLKIELLFHSTWTMITGIL